MKRGTFSDGYVSLVRSVEREYEMFKYKMLSKSKKKIFDSCNAVMFYSCLYEYFMYAENIWDEHIKACLNCGDVLASLYSLYMEYEYLRCSGRWEDIEEILNVLVRDQEKYGTPQET